VDKLYGVGADSVISPTVIGGRMLGRSVVGEDVADADSPVEPTVDDAADAE
jgi:voltage-gated potassium channel